VTPDPLARAARLWPREAALEGPLGRRSWAELDRAASGLAAFLEASGVRPGDRVAFLLPRGEAAVASLHAIPRAGAAAVPLHAGWTERELADFLARLAPGRVACAPGTRARAEAVLPDGAGLLELGPGWPPADGARAAGGATGARGGGAGAAAAWTPASTEAPPGEPLHTILSTSGTSGRPKAVGLTLANHLACARASGRRMLLGPADRWLASLSHAHVGGVALVVRSAWTGAALVLREGFDAGELAAMAADGRVTHASLVPTMLRRLVAARGSRPAPLPLRGILLGGDAADAGEVLEALELGYPLFPTYGLTEAASQVATARPEQAVRAPGTVGRPLPGTELRIGEGDEILVRGPTVMAGYVLGPGAGADARPGAEAAAGPEAGTGAVGRAGGAAGGPALGPDGWLRTGDAGRVDEEGFLWVTGRLSSRIVSGGVTVDPAAVEAVLAAHPAVRGAAVVGLPAPEWGERVAVLVVAGGPAGGLAEALEAHCRERLAAPSRPRRLAFVPSLPRNPNGKVDRAAVRAALERAPAS